jgi:RNA polymerase sigma-70 factor (ECF subfamily)
MLDWAARLRRHEVAPTSSHRQEILAEAYRAHLDAVYRYVYRRVGNRETAEDLTGEVFVKAVQGLQAERAPQSVRSWLYATAHTTIIDYWRRQGGETIDLADVEEILGTPVVEDREDTGAARRVAALLAALPERERSVLTLRFLQGHTLVETARVLHITTGNVKVLQHRALKRAAALGIDLEEDTHGRG